MKVAKLLLVAGILTVNTQAEENLGLDADINCHQQSSPQTVDLLENDVKKINCEAVNEKNSCVNVKKIDVDRRKALIDSLGALDKIYQSSGGKIELEKTQDGVYSDAREQFPDAYLAIKETTGYRTSRTQPFKPLTDSRDYYRLNKGTKVEFQSAYHTFLKRSKTEAEFENQKEIFADDYLEFESNYECAKGVDVELTGSREPISKAIEKAAGMPSCIQNEGEYKRLMSSSMAEFKNYFEERLGGKNGLERGISCDTSEIKLRSATVAAYEVRSCAGRFEQLFKDNEWDMDLSDLEGDKDFQEFKACITNMQAEGFKLTNVSVSASASQLNNTGKAAEQFCKKGFEDLSKARANSAKNLLISEFSFPDSMIHPSSRGENGNGSSGACPYKLVNGKEVLKPEFAPGKPARKELDEAKYVRVSANFEPKIIPAKKTKYCYEAYVPCSRIAYKCGEWEKRMDTGWASRQAYKRKREASSR